MKKILTLFLLFQFLITHSQHPDAKRDYQWIFGYPYYDNGVILDFNTSPSTYSAFPKKLTRDMSIANANICDTNGHIQLFTNGCDINNKFFDIIENGDSINFSNNFYKNCAKTGSPFIQISLILPKKNNQYYVFYKNTERVTGTNNLTSNKLFYSIIDFNTNPNGKVIKKDILLSGDTMIKGELTACRHANGKDWWMVDWLWNGIKDSTYRAFLIHEDTILGPFIHSIGKPMLRNVAQDQAVFSPDGKRYARIRYRDGIHLYDFDRATGIFSNYQYLPLNNDIALYTGVNFSSNSKLLYATIGDYILQYDLDAANIESTRDTVAVWDGFKDFLSTKFLYLYLGPDCKLYVGPNSTVRYLTIINYPNRKGDSCLVTQHSIKLPTIVDISLPNYPNFRLGALSDNFSPCDSTLNPIITGFGDILMQDEGKKISVAVYPNPTNGSVNMDLYGYISDYKSGIWKLVDISGNKIIEYPIFPTHTEYSFDIEFLKNGIYFWQLWLDNIPIRTGKLVVIE